MHIQYFFRKYLFGSNTDVHGIHAFFATLGIENYRIALADLIHQTGYVNKNFLARASFNNEAKTFGFIKELDSSFVHWLMNFKNLECYWNELQQR